NSTVGLAASKNVTMTRSEESRVGKDSVTLDMGTGAGNGTATYTNLRIDTSGSKQLTASASGFTSAISNSCTVSPDAATTLVFSTQPGGATAASAFGTQPVIKTQDNFRNNSTVGLAASKNVTMT